MQDLVTSGRIVDLILVLMVLEALGLIIYRQVTGKGMAAVSVMLMLLPGACLLMALRAALIGEAWSAVAGWLAASLVAHLADLWRRT